MNDNTPPVIPKEPSSWKGTVLSIAFHVVLFGTIWWMAAGHGGKTAPDADNKTASTSEAVAPAGKVASESVPSESRPAPEPKPVALAAPASSQSEQPKAQVASPETATPVAPKAASIEHGHAASKKLAASIERKKLIAEKKKKHKAELALANQRAKQKSEAVALQKKQKEKEKAQQAALLAKKRAAELALKTEAEAQKRKELQDRQALEKLHQEEMRRITSGIDSNS
jgi:hypothetical protein